MCLDDISDQNLKSMYCCSDSTTEFVYGEFIFEIDAELMRLIAPSTRCTTRVKKQLLPKRTASCKKRDGTTQTHHPNTTPPNSPFNITRNTTNEAISPQIAQNYTRKEGMTIQIFKPLILSLLSSPFPSIFLQVLRNSKTGRPSVAMNHITIGIAYSKINDNIFY